MHGVRVVLVEPRYSFNLALIARTMANFGYSDLCLVKPKEGLVKSAMLYSAKGAPILKACNVFSELGDAIDDADLRVGTSAKLSRRAGVREFVSPQEIGAIHLRFKEPVLVFGREPSGLTNEELSMMDLNTRIPTHPDYPTLNLAISVAIMLYELQMVRTPVSRDYELATVNQVDGLLRAYSYMLDAFRFPRKKVDASEKALLSLMKKANPSSREVGLLTSNLRKAGSLHHKAIKNK